MAADGLTASGWAKSLWAWTSCSARTVPVADGDGGSADGDLGGDGAVEVRVDDGEREQLAVAVVAMEAEPLSPARVFTASSEPV